MAWTLTNDVEEYLAAAGGMLSSRAAQHTILLGVSETVRVKGPLAFGNADPMFGWWDEHGAVVAALLRTPPWPMVISEVGAEAAAELADVLAGHGRDPGGVNGPADSARGFADAWQARTGQTSRVQRRTRLFRLAGLRPPEAVPGRARKAGRTDRDLIVSWLDAFRVEVGETNWRAEDAADDRLGYGGLTLWEDGGRPVSMAGTSRHVAGQVRVGPVYTPPERRGRGYGGAVTAAVSQAGLDSGAAQVLLFTDLANPTSNALYRRLGYQPVTDYLVLEFT